MRMRSVFRDERSINGRAEQRLRVTAFVLWTERLP